MKLLLILAALLFLAYHSEAKISRFRNLYKGIDRLEKPPLGADVGEPLILTPYLEEGRIEEAQQAALVQHSDFYGVESYSGYFTVDEQFDSNIFFWYFPSADSPADDPVVLWLNGGPGATSMYGLFHENGPFYVNSNYEVTLREYSWHLNHSVIFVDQPAGTGFSYTDGGLARNETKVGNDLHSVLTQFFRLFPNLQQNPFYVSGESYAGKYLPAIGYTIMNKNPTAELPINLQGILIGDGWTDPPDQINYGPFLYNTGLISNTVQAQVDEYRELALDAINSGDYSSGMRYTGEQFDLIMQSSLVNVYNFIDDSDDTEYYIDYVNRDDVRKALHVGDTVFGDKGAGEALYDDELISVAPWVEELLETYRIVIYTGQVDIICGYPMVLDYISTLNFSGKRQYEQASRDFWYVDGELAGYFRIGGNLIELMVRDAGHMVPKDQPKWGYDLLYRFTRNQPFA